MEVCSVCGIKTEEIIAFGDDYADIGMLKLCGKGIAMGNAIDEVKEKADGVIGSNDEDGIAEYLRLQMDTTRFEKFGLTCSKELPNEIDKILNMAKGEKACAIGLITTDDFYGFYLSWDYSSNIKEYYEWEFAQTLLAVLAKSIKQIPDEIFEKNNFKREDILFFATMSDGDYIQEMMELSVKMFNTSKTLNAYGIAP